MRLELIDKAEMGYENKFQINDRVKITEHLYLRTSLKKHTIYIVSEIMPVSYPTLNKKAYLYEVKEEKTGAFARFAESQIQKVKEEK